MLAYLTAEHLAAIATIIDASQGRTAVPLTPIGACDHRDRTGRRWLLEPSIGVATKIRRTSVTPPAAFAATPRPQ